MILTFSTNINVLKQIWIVLLPHNKLSSQNLQKNFLTLWFCIQHHPVATNAPHDPITPSHWFCSLDTQHAATTSAGPLDHQWQRSPLSPGDGSNKSQKSSNSSQKRRSTTLPKKKEVEEPKPSYDFSFKKIHVVPCRSSFSFKKGESLLNWGDFPIPSSGGSQVAHPGQRWSPQPRVCRGRWLWGMKRKNVCLDETCTVE